jgi:hypothetical protein
MSPKGAKRPNRNPRSITVTQDERTTIMEVGTLRLKVGLAEMLKGGVIMDVTNAEQAKIAEDAGAVAVMALERVPSDIRKEGGVAGGPGQSRSATQAVTRAHHKETRTWRTWKAERRD